MIKETCCCGATFEVDGSYENFRHGEFLDKHKGCRLASQRHTLEKEEIQNVSYYQKVLTKEDSERVADKIIEILNWAPGEMVRRFSEMCFNIECKVGNK